MNRFIPTHVGNTRGDATRMGSKSVHPHACGEHMISKRKRSWTGGSSPRMWGTLFQKNGFVIEQRFIPTHVGNTHDEQHGPGPKSVHPHACGEHLQDPKADEAQGGSSPRMWGTPDEKHRALPRVRFIPTHVGNTGSAASLPPSLPVHPHACGEHSCVPANASDFSGSSPRMWGTHNRR